MLRGVLLPIFDELFGRRLGLGADYESRILRAQLNRMTANSTIRQHRDVGYYATNAHRYHIPLIIPKCVRFAHVLENDGSEWAEIPFKEGEAFEVNNRIVHRVEQSGPFERVTLIVDLLEGPVDATVEVKATCASWFSVECYSVANVTPQAFRGDVLVR